MKPSVHLEHLAKLLSDACDVMTRKTLEYNPDQVVLLDVFRQAYAISAEPEEVLFHVLLAKHLTAIRHVVVGGEPLTDTFRTRIIDAINYLALLEFLREYRPEIQADIRVHVRDREACTCVSELGQCHRCQFLRWLETTSGSSKPGSR